MIGERGSNPRYVAYARAHGKTPAAMLDHDRTAWSGGCMCGFILWMSKQKQAFWEVYPSAFLDRYTLGDQDAWTAFLQSVAEVDASAGAIQTDEGA